MAINPNERFNRVTVGRGRSANRDRTRGSGNTAGVMNSAFQTNMANQIMPRPSNNMIGGLIDGAIGLGESMYNTNLANQNVANNQAIFDQQAALQRPGNITGSAVNVNYNPDTNTLTAANNPQLQGLLANLYNQTGGMSNQLANLDPFQLGNYIYEQGSEARNLDQARQTNQALERLQATGMLNSSSGNQLQGSLAQAQNLANAQERAATMMQGQEIANAIANRQNAAINSIYGADSLSQNAIQNAISMGIAPPSAAGLQTAYTNQMDTKAKTGGGLADVLGMAGTALGGPIGGMLGSVVGGLFS